MTLPTYHLEIKGIDELLRRLAGYNGLASKHLKRAMQQAVTIIESEVRPLVPVGVSGRLRNSIGSEVHVLGPTDIEGRVGSSLKDEIYPLVMEFGREPGHGISAEGMLNLIRWVHVKGLAGRYSVKTRRRLGRSIDQAVEDAQVAAAIATAIRARGIKGRFYMKRGFEAGRVRALQAFEAVPHLITEEIANGR